MKTFLIILISLIVIAGSALWYFSDTVSASISKIYSGLTTQKTGLVGYWNFDDCDTCSTATDLSGNGNTGTFQLDAAHTANGKIKRGATFDGTGDYVDMGDPASGVLDGFNEMTISAWFAWNGSGAQDHIVAKGNTGDYSYAIHTNSNNTVGGRTWSSAGGANFDPDSTVTVNNNKWYHVVFVAVAGTRGDLYLDGILQESDTTQTSSPWNTNSAAKFYVGGRQDTGGDFDGQIDEVRVYNRVLSAAEIKTLYDQGSAKFAMKSTVKSANNTGLVAYWNFDDCDTCSTAIDLSGNRNTGTFTADAAHTANGKIGRGATFDGTGDYVLVNDSASLDLTSALTVSVWFNLNSLTCTGVDNSGGIVAKHDSVTTKDGYILIYVCTDDKLYWQGGDGTTWASLSIASVKTFSETGRWYHVAGTFDGTTGYLYADGELTGSDTSAALSDNNTNFWIGGDVNKNSNFLNAKLDEIRVYNRVLSAAEIKTLYDQGSAKFTIKSANNTGLVGYWNFDDCDTCSTAIDLSGNRNTGTFTADAAHTANGKIGRGATFDGTGDYVLVNDSASLDLTSAITVSAWFNLNSLTCTGVNNVGVLASKHNSATTKDGYALYYSCGDDKMYLQGGDGTTWASLTIASAKTFSETGKWYHIAATFNGTTGYLYADGELTGSDTSAALSDNNQNFWIGGDVNANSNFLNAKLDEIRVYNRVLSAAEIKTLYQSGR